MDAANRGFWFLDPFILAARERPAFAQAEADDLAAPGAAKLLLNPGDLNFGTVAINTTSPAQIERSAGVSATKKIIFKNITASGVFSVSDDHCSGTKLTPGSDCEVDVVCAPTATGLATGTLTYKFKLSGSKTIHKAIANLSCTGAPPPAACATPGPGVCPASGPPTMLSLIPSSAVAGANGFSLAVCGCNLTASTAVQWNGAGRTTSFISSNELGATIPASDVANIGMDLVTVSSAAATAVSAPQTFFVGSTGGDGFAEVEIDQQTKDIVYDPVNQAIYLSVPGSAPTNGNTISVLSLASASITSSPFAGSNPDALAISDDSAFLYAGIDGAAKVQRFTLPSLTKDISYALGSNVFFGSYFALDLQVAPGAPHTTAVSLGNTGVSPAAIGGIEIFDDSTARPTIAKGFGPGGGGGVLYDSIQWGSDDTALFAENNEDTGFDFYTLTVDPSGVVLANDFSGAFSSFRARIHFDSGSKVIYSDDGHAIDPSTGDPVGQYSIGFNNVMVPDSTLNKVFFVDDAGTIEAFDLTEFSSIGSVVIPDVSDFPLRIIRWGNNGLAFNTFDGKFYLLGGNFVR